MNDKCCEHCDCKKEPVSTSATIAIDALERVCANGEFAEQIEAATRLLNYERGY